MNPSRRSPALPLASMHAASAWRRTVARFAPIACTPEVMPRILGIANLEAVTTTCAFFDGVQGRRKHRAERQLRVRGETADQRWTM